MKCENCGSELVGGAIVCRQCNHNNAQGRVSQWRARRTGDLQPPSTRSISPLADAARPSNSAGLKSPLSESRPLEPRRSNSIPFEPRIQINHAPPSPKGASGSLSPAPVIPLKEDNLEADQQPAWRAQLKERVKQSRERKVLGPNVSETEPDEAELDPNPIVEAALKRIRWSAHTQPTASMPRIARHGAQAAALAHEPEFDVEPLAPIESKPPALTALPALPTMNPAPPVESKIDLKPTARVATTTTNPLLARSPNTKPVNQPETKPQPQHPSGRLPVPPKPDPKPAIAPRTDAKIESWPSTKPETKPAIEGKVSEPNPRVTGELKPPTPPPVTKPAPEKAPPEKSPSGSLSPGGRKAVETTVIGLPQPAAAPSAKQKSAAKDRQATMWVRTLAGACDFEIVATAYLPLFASYATLNTTPETESLSIFILIVLLATLTFCYQLLTLTFADRTSGMALLNLRLINTADKDNPILFSQKFARALAATIVFLCPLLNLISNQHHHTLPDMFSGTTLLEK